MNNHIYHRVYLTNIRTQWNCSDHIPVHVNDWMPNTLQPHYNARQCRPSAHSVITRVRRWIQLFTGVDLLATFMWIRIHYIHSHFQLGKFSLNNLQRQWSARTTATARRGRWYHSRSQRAPRYSDDATATAWLATPRQGQCVLPVRLVIVIFVITRTSL